MRLVRVAAAALNQTPLDWDGNVHRIRDAIEQARAVDARILCLPELAITGYGCEDAFHSNALVQRAAGVVNDLLAASRGMLVCVGLPVRHTGGLFNACAVLADQQLVGVVAKQFLAGDGLHYEPRWFKPWPNDVVGEIELAGHRCPIGDLVFEFDQIRLGFEICEDAWVAQRPGLDHAAMGVDLVFNPSASHFAFDKAVLRRRLVTEASRSLGVSYVYSNLVGNEAGRVIYDGQTLIASGGELLAEGPRLRFDPVVLTTAVVDVDSTRRQRAQSVSYQPQVQTDPQRCLAVDLRIPDAEPSQPTGQAEPWETSEFVTEEEFTRAVALGLFDYLRKSRLQGFVVSLSGGADSAAVACLVAIMVRIGISQLGIQQFCARLGLAPASRSPAEPRPLVKQLLLTVYQATRNSSSRTRQAARQLAEAIAAHHAEVDVDDVCEAYTQKAAAVLGRSLEWATDDIALQNIQARTRGPLVWMLANVRNALLLATSNRSEAAVGYATMDGDTCGSISPIAGIDKAFLLSWLRWLEQHGPAECGPLEALSVINDLEPTAELRPEADGQTDEADLMPYPVLDAIEHHAIGEKRSPAEVLQMLESQFDQSSHAQRLQWVRRFFQLWSRNQWKRERYAPSFHVDDKNLDPKTWCRFPILSGGFERELAELPEND